MASASAQEEREEQVQKDSMVEEDDPSSKAYDQKQKEANAR